MQTKVPGSTCDVVLKFLLPINQKYCYCIALYIIGSFWCDVFGFQFLCQFTKSIVQLCFAFAALREQRKCCFIFQTNTVSAIFLTGVLHYLCIVISRCSTSSTLRAVQGRHRESRAQDHNALLCFLHICDTVLKTLDIITLNILIYVAACRKMGILMSSHCMQILMRIDMWKYFLNSWLFINFTNNCHKIIMALF